MGTQLQEWLTLYFWRGPNLSFVLWLVIMNLINLPCRGNTKTTIHFVVKFFGTVPLFSHLNWISFFFFPEKNQSQVFINETLSFNLWFLLDSNVSVSRRKDCKDVWKTLNNNYSISPNIFVLAFEQHSNHPPTYVTLETYYSALYFVTLIRGDLQRETEGGSLKFGPEPPS